MRWLLTLLLATFLVSGQSFAASRDTVVIVVRHAEKATDDPKDPSLSDTGQARARSLAKALVGLPRSATFTTQYRRTRLTAEPAAQASGISVQVREANAANSKTYADELLALVRRQHRGGNVLVVGHSNTVPEIVKTFSGTTVEPLADGDYDRIYVITLAKNGKARLVQLRY